jgi:flagellar protein FliO/FliZ
VQDDAVATAADAGASAGAHTTAAPLRTEASAEWDLFFEETPAEPSLAAGPSLFALFRVVLTLALVAAGIYGLVFFLKKQNAARTTPDPYLKVLARTQLSPRAAAVIIAAGDRAWLLGLTDEQVSLVTAIEDKELVDAMLLDAANREIAEKTRRADFQAMLTKLSAGFAKKTAAEPSGANLHTERLNRLGKL